MARRDLQGQRQLLPDGDLQSRGHARPVGGATIAGVHQEAFGTVAITANTFTHLATTYDGSAVRLFVNGTQVASKAATGSIATSTNQLQIGGDSIYGQYFAGTIDEVRIYNTALTQAQIQADMNSPIGSGSSDTEPPTAPTNLTAAAAGSSQIDLTWSASTDNVGVTGYIVERCQGGGCSNFASLPGSPTGTAYTDTGLSPNTTYRYRVRAVDAASNLSGYSNIVGATTQSGGGAPPGLVAAYAFDEATGSTLSDASGNGNTGTISGATWTSGRYSYGLAFNGSSARVNVQDAPSLDLTSAMTLEAWVKPTTVTSSWRDVIYKGNDNYYLMATSSPGGTARPVGGATIAGVHQEAFGTVAITANTFTHLATTYDGSAVRLFVNGTQVASKAATGSIATSTNQLQIGGDSIYGQYFAGTIDEVRIYNTALTQAQIQADMNSPIGSGSSDTQAPTAPTGVTATGVTSSEIDVTWTPSTDDVGVAGYRVFRNGTQVGTSTYPSFQDIGLSASTSYTYTVRAFDGAGNTSPPSAAATGTTRSSGTRFQNDVLATGFDLPTNIEFLPDGRMLVVELQGKILVLPPPYTQPDPDTLPAAHERRLRGRAAGPLRHRAGSELHDQPLLLRLLHDRDAEQGSVVTVHGERLAHRDDQRERSRPLSGSRLTPTMSITVARWPSATTASCTSRPASTSSLSSSQNLTSPRGKIHRINPDGSIPTDNPFYDGAGPNWDSVWA